ncbi:hypothetical protein DL93DRAFT_2069734 [Clavulina sp. PMI_390]|nr:hypothetical protein DL93DRAFT_2069734 [Clavulina sp. PMI_390]
MPRSEYATRRNSSPGSNTSGSSSSGSSPESSADSSSRGVGSSSSEISPPSSASSTPPNHGEAKIVSVQRAPQQQEDSSTDSNQDQLRPHQQQQHAAPHSPSRQHHRLINPSSPTAGAAGAPVPLYYSVNVNSARDVAAIQAQVEAAFPPQQQRPERSTNIKHPHSTQAGQSLRAHLAASSTARDYYASEEDLGAASTRPRASGSGTSKLASASVPERTLNEAEQNELAWMNELMAKGRQEGPLSGESLIDAVIVNNYQWRLANRSPPGFSASSSQRPQPVPITGTAGSSSSSGSSGSTSSTFTLPTPTPSNPYSNPPSSPRRHAHPQQQQIHSPRPSIPIATKQLPYQNLAAYQGAMLSAGMPVRVDPGDPRVPKAPGTSPGAP